MVFPPYIPQFQPPSATKDPVLQIPRRRVHQRRDHERKLVRHVPTIIANCLPQRPYIPRLDHAHAPRHHAQPKRRARRQPQRQPRRVVPAVEVVVLEVALAEEDVLAEQDDEVARAPVPEQGQEVREVGVELLAAAEGESKDGAKAQDGPDEAGHACERAGGLLAGDGGAVDGDDVCVDSREDEEGEDELGKAVRVQHGLNEEAEGLIFVGGLPGRFVVEGGRNDAAGDHADGGGERDAEGRHEEDLDAGDVGRVVDVVVGGHGAPGGGAAVDDGQEGEDGTGERGAGEGGRRAVVGVSSGLTEDDHENDEEDEPSVALVDEDRIQADEADEEGYHSEDDDAEGERDVPVRNGVQREPTGNARHGSPTDLLHRVQDRDQFVRIPAEAVPADADLSQTRRRAKCRTVSRHRATEYRPEYRDEDGLLETQPELPTQEPRREAGSVHGAAGPEQGHGHLLDPGDGLLVLGALAHDRLTLDAQLGVHAGLEAAHAGEEAMVLTDGDVVV